MGEEKGKEGKGPVVFLTSSPDASYQVDGEWVTGPFTSRNGFLERVRAAWPAKARVLLITATPDEEEKNREMADYFQKVFAASDLPVARMRLVEEATARNLPRWMETANVLILGGGHVPTQNAFFQRLRLRRLLEKKPFSGVIIGISAGSMNGADRVYAQPELPGEAIDPDYVRDLPGLGLTRQNILPHYQMVKDNWLDGMRLMEDITYGDSIGRQGFYALEDGSYLLCAEGRETIYGVAYRIAGGRLTQVCREGESLELAGDERGV